MDSYVNAIILGIVEGLTEFLPISSTGHLILTGELLGQSGVISDTFEVFIQIGAILAVLLCYFSRFWHLLFPKKTENKEKAFSGLHGIYLLILTTLPGASLGLIFHAEIKSLFSAKSVAIALIIGGVLMLLVEKFHKEPKTENIDQLTPKTALGVGLFQCFALFPGFSRSAATIMGGMILGLKREVAAEYSFVAAVPIICGAAFFDLIKSLEYLNSSHIPYFALGTFVSFIFAMIAIKSFIALLGRVGLVPFAWYRIILAIPVLYFSA